MANLEEGYREGDIRSSKIGCKLSQQKKFLSHGSILSLLCQEITTNPHYGEAQNIGEAVVFWTIPTVFLEKRLIRKYFV